MSALRFANDASETYLHAAENNLRVALDYARQAGCPRLATKIRAALKSADGAKRHMQRRRASAEK